MCTRGVCFRAQGTRPVANATDLHARLRAAPALLHGLIEGAEDAPDIDDLVADLTAEEFGAAGARTLGGGD